jgi:hypothetical protein
VVSFFRRAVLLSGSFCVSVFFVMRLVSAGLSICRSGSFVAAGAPQRFARQQFNCVRTATVRLWSRMPVCVRFDVTMIMIDVMVLQILEHVADVQKSIAIETDVNESRLHSREDSSNPAFVDAADERELFFPLDVDFD